MFIILSNQENIDHVTLRFHLTQVRMTKINKQLMTNAGGEEGKRKPSFTVGGLQTGAGTMEIPCLPP